MKTKIIMIIDVILIIITILFLWDLNNDNTPSFGMDALSELAEFIKGLIFLGIEALIFIITGIIMIYKHFHK